jgi:hypothetical protein
MLCVSSDHLDSVRGTRYGLTLRMLSSRWRYGSEWMCAAKNTKDVAIPTQTWNVVPWSMSVSIPTSNNFLRQHRACRHALTSQHNPQIVPQHVGALPPEVTRLRIIWVQRPIRRSKHMKPTIGIRHMQSIIAWTHLKSCH